MGQTANQIETNIENQREDLTSNLRALEYKVKSATDWRHQFRTHPMTFVGLAFGGGILLSAATGRSSSGRPHHHYYGPMTAPETNSHSQSRAPRRPPSPAVEQAYRTWDNIKGALVGIAATRLKDYVEGMLPGFSAEYNKAESQHSGPSSHTVI